MTYEVDERHWAMMLHFLYYQSTIIIPLITFYIFNSIINNTYNTSINTALVISIAGIKLVKPFLRVCAEGRLRRIGQKMHSILSMAVISKTLKVSLLSSQSVTSSELLKIMQIDMERIIAYPEVSSYLWVNYYTIIFNILLIVFLFGWAGFAGIIVLLLTLSLRVCFKKIIDKYEEELGRETSSRVQKTVDIFNIIKFIKVAALEIPYYLKLVELREIELNLLHSKNTF
jgi:ABC-type transport system involved in cytochrome bd biosynthesis fused ATPase/permease subunit